MCSEEFEVMSVHLQWPVRREQWSVKSVHRGVFREECSVLSVQDRVFSSEFAFMSV